MSAIVMRAALRSVFPQLLPGVTWQYFIIENPFKPIKGIPAPGTIEKETTIGYGSREVSRKTALEYIEDNGLEYVLKTKDGEIYDKPWRPFKDMYSARGREREIERIWDNF